MIINLLMGADVRTPCGQQIMEISLHSLSWVEPHLFLNLLYVVGIVVCLGFFPCLFWTTARSDFDTPQLCFFILFCV